MVQVLNRGSNEAPLSERVQRKNDARRLEILRAAARVFRRLGLSATGMREIAEEADLSPGNLYYYFSGKDERSEEHTSELQSQSNLVCRLLLEKKKKKCTEIQH